MIKEATIMKYIKLLLLGLFFVLVAGCSDTEHSHQGDAHQGHKHVDPAHQDNSTNEHDSI